ncbi:MAG: serine/threonine-protein kinase, partial [Planctomycetes bacterium]|nr:serine/threonine-protein kinase [Planctomycetota bacterium]
QSRGLEPDIDDFVKAYPDLASQIRQRILNLRKIDTLFDSLVQAEESDFDGAAPGQDLVGQTIGGFEVVEIIGRGGMGVVYLARDTSLDRSVAIKSLPSDRPGDPRSHTRFRREAKLLASLNHANIAIIHEIIEQADGSEYLILEYIPGETLAQRIARASIKPAQALAFGQQIAEAVAAAHEKGVIHRDLKPGNIKITLEGKVKVLDFGLAKATAGKDNEKDILVTQPGHIMGTPAYMSPEQARGRPVDKRCDIWSFGCVLYEMLTGASPFAGDTVSDTLAHTLQTEPDWQAVPKATPSNIRVLLRRCLEKDPCRRLRDIGDAAIEISETLSGTAKSLALPKEVGAVSRLFQRHVVLGGAACLIAGALIAGVLVASLMRPIAPRVSRTSIPVPPDKRLVAGASPTSCLAMSPDGTRFVYVGRTDEGKKQLYLRHMDKMEIRAVAGTEDAGNPFFSPDGQRVGFFTPDLKVVSLAGGLPQTLKENVGDVAFGTWADDGTIVFSVMNGGQGLQQISEDGEPSGILKKHIPDTNDVTYAFPQVLPGSKTILYSRFV